MDFADWDEANVAENEKYFKKVKIYKKNVEEMAKSLPYFERKEVILMLEEATAGFIFFNHKNVPKWTLKNYGENFSMREDTYTAYDIDNPEAREMMSLLIKGTVPKMAGKKYMELGYMLCNEPHFYTQKNVWATGPVSEFTIEKFKIWLKKKHGSIKKLNNVWKTDFKNFESVEINVWIIMR